MAYRPKRDQSFGPPAAAWVLPSVYFVLAVTFAAIVFSTAFQTSGGWLYRYIVEGDDQRILGSRTIACLLLLGGIAALLRTRMRGVTIHPDGLGMRDVVGLGWPKVRNCGWAEIDEIVVDRKVIGLRMWNGDVHWLPKVLDHAGLCGALERVGVARSIPMRGDGLRTVEEVRAELEELGSGDGGDGGDGGDSGEG